ncbi:hypothetical protein B0H66DRAFT_60364 [Apodospora peruviana]|uniref:Pentatricopeptide repeat protein n=1 Tax=Apodospora peruviana TaxID=516989 RepID=A0AAE0ISC6_9PEZI|nr:hypothetical protein B0H66DRAFT_60364 [Apodospora peruviana]
MPPRTPFSLDLSRTSYVCQSCVTNLRAQGPQLWLTRSVSNVSRRAQPLRPRSAPVRGKLKTRAATPALKQDLQRVLAETLAQDDKAAQDHERDNAGQPPVDIRFFDEAKPGQLRELKSSEEFGDVSGGLDSEIETAITDLEGQMLNMLGLLKRLEKEGDQDKADELRKQFKKTLRDQYKGRIGPEADDYKALHIPGFSGPRQRSIAALNKFLARESLVKGGVPRHKDLLECWKSYSAARKTLAMSWASVAPEVWDFLWMILSWEGTQNPNRMRHVYVLARDMHAAGVTLRSSQQLLAIEAMFIEGWQEEAIESWKKAVVTLGSKSDTFKAYWELGARMCCLYGDTYRAQRAVDTLLESAEDPNPRIIIPLIRALAAKADTQKQAWEMYQRLRELLGDDMKIEDYDEVISSFLTASGTEDALQAFVDMMFSGAIDIRGRTRLPIAVGNHFFIGKWLKRLIGAGDLDGAYKVVLYLRAKGVVPSPIQLNGLIGAWLRSDIAENVEKAEQLAWDMIRSRLSFVRLRRRGAAMEQQRIRFYDPTVSAVPSAYNPDDPELNIGTRASSETFALLAENYCTRGLHDRLEGLWEVLGEAEINTSAFFMNQLIRSYTQNMQASRAVEFYEEMTRNRGVRPNAHTFLALFGTLSVNRLIHRDPSLSEIDITAARRFFRDMVEAEWTFESMDTFQFLPRTILFSLLKAKDFTGMIVAARTMRELFQFVPSEPLLIELASGTVTLRVKTQRNMRRIMEGSKTIEGLIRRHRMALEEAGVDMGTEAQRADELCKVFEQLVLVKAGAQEADPQAVERLLEEAAGEVGVYDIAIAKDREQIAKHRKVVQKAGSEDD